MRAGGDLGDDATVGSKNVYLGGDDVAQNMSAIFDDGGTGVIATALDSQNFHEYIISYLLTFRMCTYIIKCK